MIEGAIFDLDGTILDSMHLWAGIGSRYLRARGIEPREDIDKVFKAFTLVEGAEFFQNEYNVQMTTEEIVDDVNRWVEQAYFDEVVEKKGIREFLEALKKQNVKMCIATLTERYQVEAALKRLDLYGYFDAIFTSMEEGISKREPDIFRKALAQLGTKKEKTIVLEDAAYALQTAKTEGFITCGIYDIHCKEPDRVRALSDIYLESYTDTSAFWSFVQSV